ncbi:MAG TPA: hypothetical protein VF837_01100 [Patescibacteria group bacterium]
MFLMTIYVFGNQDLSEDALPFLVSKKFKNLPGIIFRTIKPNEDLPLPNDKKLYILDTVVGLDKVTLLTEKEIDRLILSRSTTAHDYDLGFQLKYLRKIGKLEKFTIIGLPMNTDLDYDLINSIFKKLVAQDMQGS